MDSKSLVLYDRNDEDIIRNDETVTYENPLEGILNRTIEKQNTTNPARKTDSIESYKECDKHKDTVQSTNDRKDTSFSIDKENTPTQLLDEYKYCKDVISYITSKNSLNNSEKKDLPKSVYRNVNDVFVFTITNANDIESCPKMSEKTSDDSQKPCPFTKPCDNPKPCQAPKPSDTAKPCDTPKPCNAPKPCDTPKPCDSPKPCDKESDRKITCSPNKSDSQCNEKSSDDSNKCSKESCKSSKSQLSDCILKCLEIEKSESSSCSKSDATEDNAPCLHKNVAASADMKPCPNKSSSTSSFQNFIESSATTLTTFKTSLQDFIGTVCDKTREAVKFITDEGVKALGLKEKPCSAKNCEECDPGCSKAKKCHFNSNNDFNIEEENMASHIYEDVSCKSNVHEVLKSIVASKLERSSKYDVPKVDEAGMSITSLLGSIKDRVVSLIYPLGDDNQGDENDSGKREKEKKACRSDAISPCQIINIDNAADEEKVDPTTETIDELKCKTDEDEHFEL